MEVQWKESVAELVACLSTGSQRRRMIPHSQNLKTLMHLTSQAWMCNRLQRTHKEIQLQIREHYLNHVCCTVILLKSPPSPSCHTFTAILQVTNCLLLICLAQPMDQQRHWRDGDHLIVHAGKTPINLHRWETTQRRVRAACLIQSQG